MEKVTTKRLALYSGRTHPALAEEVADAPRHRARPCRTSSSSPTARSAPVRRERPRHRRVHHADPLRRRRTLDQRLDHGAADHDRRRVPGVGQADHRGVPVLRLRPPGPQGRGPRADHGPPRRRPVQGRRRQADGLDRPAQRPDPGLLRRPGRPPHGDAGARGLRPRSNAERAGHRVARRRPHQGRRAHGPAPRRLRRRPRLHLQAPAEGHGQRRRGQGSDRRRRRPAVHPHRRHDRHRRHHRRRRRDPARSAAPPRCGRWPPTACSSGRRSTG